MRTPPHFNFPRSSVGRHEVTIPDISRRSPDTITIVIQGVTCEGLKVSMRSREVWGLLAEFRGCKSIENALNRDPLRISISLRK